LPSTWIPGNPLVVEAVEDHRGLEDAGEVHRLLAVGVRGGPISQIDERRAVLALHPGGIGHADGVGYLARDRNAEGQVPDTLGNAHPVGVARVVEDQILERPPAPHVRRPFPVVGHHPVGIAQGVDAAEDRGLVAPDGAEGPDPALALQPEHSLVEATGEEERAIEASEVGGRNRGVEVGVEVTLGIEDRHLLHLGYVEGLAWHAAGPPR